MNKLTTILALALGFSGTCAWAGAQPVPVTILHTNDLHSHFRGERTPLGLGGVARLKTAIDRARASVPHSLLVDGGDWSEGNIYYTQGAGRETLRMMDHMGYDVAVVGNHDWLNGPGTLLDIIGDTSPSVSLIAANVDVSAYDRGSEFTQKITPYVIKEIGGVKIAFIGLVTYEFVYDSFFRPVKITGPFSLTAALATQLKHQVDAVVVVSHNSIALNQQLLKMAPDVDLVIGAHDHVQLNKPVIVQRPGHPDAWIVETGCWGRYLGRVDFQVTPRDATDPSSEGSVQLLSYGLTQMDASIPEDAATAARVNQLDSLIEARVPHILHDHVGDAEMELSRDGTENPMSDFATDAYLHAVQADLAIDQTALIYGEIHEGPVRTVDVFNSNPGVWSPETQKSWTLHTIPISGKTLQWVLNLLYSTRAASLGSLSASGLHVVYNPLIGAPSSLRASRTELFQELSAGPRNDYDLGTNPVIRTVEIGGQPLDENKTYKVAAPGGIVEALQFIDTLFPNAVPMDQLADTGLEDWRIIGDYLSANSPITRDKVQMGRIQSEQPDLGILYDDIQWTPLRSTPRGEVGRVTVRVTNYGATASPATGPQIELDINANGVNYALDPQYVQVGASQAVFPLNPGESRTYSWDQVTVPATLGLRAITARLQGTDAEINHSNDLVTRYFPAAAGH